MALAPSGPAGFPGWGDLAPLEAVVWGWTFLPGKRPLRQLALAQGRSESSLKTAKARGRAKLEAAAIAHGTTFDFMLDAYKRGQKAMENAPKD